MKMKVFHLKTGAKWDIDKVEEFIADGKNVIKYITQSASMGWITYTVFYYRTSE